MVCGLVPTRVKIMVVSAVSGAGWHGRVSRVWRPGGWSRSGPREAPGGHARGASSRHGSQTPGAHGSEQPRPLGGGKLQVSLLRMLRVAHGRACGQVGDLDAVGFSLAVTGLAPSAFDIHVYSPRVLSNRARDWSGG